MIPRFALLILLAAAAVATQRFDTPAQAMQQAAPAKVWVNTRSGVYHCPGTRYWSNTKSGVLLSEDAAIAKGYRPANGRSCGLTAPAASSDSVSRARPLAALAAPKSRAEIKVWVNTNSGVYHCPGTRYYGNTKSGEYMEESAARAAGHRPAHGATCR